jgi:hypothetical protein
MQSFSSHLTDDTGVMYFCFTLHMAWGFVFFLGMSFWVCPTTPMTSAGTIAQFWATSQVHLCPPGKRSVHL